MVMPDEISVKDDELIYRRVACNTQSPVEFYRVENGILRVSSQAFRDREKRPSVDLAALCSSNPAHTQIDPTDGVIELIIGRVRQIKNIRKIVGNDTIEYDIDVIPRPIESNEAHAQIEPSPEFSSGSTFKKLQERLARLASDAGWKIYPSELR